jgi:hypothetical protein
LVSHNFDYVGFYNVSAFGGSGVWFSGSKSLPPSVWQVKFPANITSQVVSEKYPDGQLTNSDLEMAGVLLHYLVLEAFVPDLSCQQAVIGCDNSPVVAWMQQMTTQASSPVAH